MFLLHVMICLVIDFCLVVERFITIIATFMECVGHILLSSFQMHCLIGICGKRDGTTKLHVFNGTKMSSPEETDYIVK